MVNKKFISDHDIQLFQETLEDVRPLKEKHPKHQDTADTHRNPPTVKPQPASHFKSTFEIHPPIQLNSPGKGNILLPSFSIETSNEPLVKPEEKLFFTRPGLQQKQLQKLKKGKLPIAASIDLHGLHTAGALKQLEDFFAQCLGAPNRCFCIIHGKGQEIPVLKNLVNQFLKQQSWVLAFCSAPAHQGGAGATLVLIKSTL